MAILDYLPHGMIAAFAGVVAHVFNDHVKQDDARFLEIKNYLGEIIARQERHNLTMTENHAEILKLLIEAGHQREMQAAILREQT